MPQTAAYNRYDQERFKSKEGKIHFSALKNHWILKVNYNGSVNISYQL